MLPFREWSHRALESVYQMVRHAMFDAIREMEASNRTPNAIYMSREFRDFWERYHLINDRYMPITQAGEREMFYGLPIQIDRNLDQRAGQSGHLVADARIVTRGFGSAPVRMEVFDHPERLDYTVEVQGGLDRVMRRREHISYRLVRSEPGMITPEQHEARLRNLNEMDAILRQAPVAPVAVAEYGAIKRPKKEMCDLLIAWNS
jgi:hypothetical protein